MWQCLPIARLALALALGLVGAGGLPIYRTTLGGVENVGLGRRQALHHCGCGVAKAVAPAALNQGYLGLHRGQPRGGGGGLAPVVGHDQGVGLQIAALARVQGQ